MAEIAALTIEVRVDANHVRQRAVIEALRGLADGLKAQADGTEASTEKSQ